MKLLSVRTIKVWRYQYKNAFQKNKHKQQMLLAKFEIEKERELEIEYSQTIKEIE